MAAVVAPPPSMSRLTSESSVSSETSPTGFTAVNGKEPLPNGFRGKNYESSRPNSQHEYNNKSRSDNDRDGAGSSPVSSRSHESSDFGANKRKRSSTDDTTGYSPVSRYDCSPPKRLEQPQHMADRALHVLGNVERMSPPHYQHPNESQRDHPHEEQQPGWNGHHPEHHQSWGTSNGNHHEPSDTHLADALQRATHESPRSHSGWGSREGDQDDDRRAYSQEQTPQSSTGPNGLKRKRNFSNRTKTGCLTCRRRKKKCDEAHPKCNNCQRGGFDCEGYSNQRDVWKSSIMKAPITLQAKDGYQDQHDASYKQETRSPDSRPPPSQHPEGGQMRPITIEDNENGQPQFMSSPQSTEPRIRPSYPAQGQSWRPAGQGQGHNDYNTEHHHNMSQAQAAHSSIPQHQAEYVPPSSRRDSRATSTSHQPHSSHNPPQTQWTSQQPSYPSYQPQHPTPPSRMDTSSSTTPSRMSTGGTVPSSFAPQSGPRTFTAQEVEKSKMLRGAVFNYLDPMLENERLRCDEALDRFNTASKLRSGATQEHRDKLLTQVFDPSLDTLHHPIVACKEKGTLGPRVKIEAPFTCTYGYNITLRDDAFVGRGCNFDDSSQIDIGQRAWIGPGVSILTTDVGKDMVERKGWESKWVAKGVFIGNEVVIGAGAVIYPGVHLARGATVEPYAIVKHNLGENQTQQAVMAPRF